MRRSWRTLALCAAMTLGLIGVRAAAADATPLAAHCDIAGVTLPVSVDYAVDDGTPVAGGATTRATIGSSMPTLPLTVTVDTMTVEIPIPAGVAKINTVAFTGGNLSASYTVKGDSLILAFDGPQTSTDLTIPTITITETVAAGSAQAAPAWTDFSEIDATTNAGDATCTPGTVATPPALARPAPDPNPFYTSPAGFASKAPGTVLRTRTVAIRFLGIPVPVDATQALFRTTDSLGNAVTTVTTVLVPRTGWDTARQGPRPLVSYQIAIDDIRAQCQPSEEMQQNGEGEMALFAPLLQAGDVVAVTDYEGPRFAYSAGVVEGQATLDGIRAAEQIPGTGLDGTRTPVAMWGYSGGAIATGWAAQLQPSYAPELNVKAVAMGGTPADLLATAQHMNGGPFSGLMLLAVIGITREYPYFSLAFNAAGRAMVSDLTNASCGTLGNAYQSLAPYVTVPDPLSNPLVEAVMAQTKLGGTAPTTAPILLYHAVYDEGIPYQEAVNLRAAWCAKGANITFQPHIETEHASLQVFGAQGAIDFIQARFAGHTTGGNCGRTVTATPGPLTPVMQVIDALASITTTDLGAFDL